MARTVKPRRRLIAIGAVGLWLSAGCSVPAEVSVSAPATVISDATCSAFVSLQITRQDVTTAKPTPRAELARQLDRWVTAADTLAGAAEGDLQQPAVQYAALVRVERTLWLEAWGDNGTQLRAEADNDDSTLGGFVLRDGLELPDGSTTTERRYETLTGLLTDRLTLRCSAPPDDWRPVVDDPSLDVPTGRLLHVVADGAHLRIREVSTSGSIGVGVQVPNGMQATNPVLSADRTQLAMVTFDRDTRQVLVGSSDGKELHSVGPASQAWVCPSWDPDGKHLVVTRKTAAKSWVMSRVDAATGEPIADLSPPRPWRSAPCGVATDDHLLFSAQPPGFATSVWSADRSGRNEKVIVELKNCAVTYPVVSPDQSHIIVIATCNDAYRDGMYTALVDGSQLRHTLTGHVAAPTWSSDGEWIAFGYSALGQPIDLPELWIANRAGTGARKIVDAWASWPAWLAGS